MARQKPGVYDRVLECAKDEFLSKGFLDASLRAIAQEAGTSTGSIYTRFGDKEGLFQAIVEPVVDQFKAMFREIQESFHQLDGETQKAEMGQYTAHHQLDLLDYIYDHFDVFRLLLDGAHGTRFSCFLDELVDIEVEYTYQYMEIIGCESVKSGQVTEEFIHIIVTAYFNGMFEVVRHNMDRAAARRYVKMLNDYHMAGFGTVFDPQP
jgi:AcrR family transcriptional regulator